MKFKNVTKEPLKFECGDEDKVTGERVVMVAGTPTRIKVRKRVPRVFTVKPGEVVDLEEGYALPRGGIKERGSYLFDELGLKGKLVPVEEAAS